MAMNDKALSRRRFLRLAAAGIGAAGAAGVLAACGGTSETKKEENVDGATKTETVEITDAHGTIEVPVNPEKVVALDNRTFETLAAWDIDLVAAPIFSQWPK